MAVDLVVALAHAIAIAIALLIAIASAIALAIALGLGGGMPIVVVIVANPGSTTDFDQWNQGRKKAADRLTSCCSSLQLAGWLGPAVGHNHDAALSKG